MMAQRMWKTSFGFSAVLALFAVESAVAATCASMEHATASCRNCIDDAAFAIAIGSGRVGDRTATEKTGPSPLASYLLSRRHSRSLITPSTFSPRQRARVSRSSVVFAIGDGAPSMSRSRLWATPFPSSDTADEDCGVDGDGPPRGISRLSSSSSSWANRALLFSSLSDGVAFNPLARTYLRHSLVACLLRERVTETERGLEDSAKFSPCCGPTNVEALGWLEDLDFRAERGRDVERRLADAMSARSEGGGDDSEVVDDAVSCSASWAEEVLAYLGSGNGARVRMRILYVPTAMYALDPKSKNTPGKQRQRGRADGKKRRTKVIQLVEELISVEDMNTLAITLDLDDGSLKQPVGSEVATLFPKDGVEAFTSWAPHLVYVEGGNTFWLRHCIEKGQWTDFLRGSAGGSSTAAVVKFPAVYCGKSAGAIIAGTNVSTASWKGWDDPSVVPGKDTFEDWTADDCVGLGLAGPMSFFPHMSDEWVSLVKERTEILGNSEEGREEQGFEKLNHPVCCMREEDACCVFGESEKLYVVSTPTVFRNNS